MKMSIYRFLQNSICDDLDLSKLVAVSCFDFLIMLFAWMNNFYIRFLCQLLHLLIAFDFMSSLSSIICRCISCTVFLSKGCL